MKYLFVFLLISLFSTIIVRQKKGKGFPYMLLFFVLLSLAGVFIQGKIEKKRNDKIENFLSNYISKKNLASDSILQENYPNDSLLTISYNGVSLLYPNDWSAEKETSIEGFSYQIFLKKEDGINFPNSISIGWIKCDYDLNKVVLDASEGISNPDIKLEIINNIRDSKFKGVDCKIADYKLSLSGNSWYNRITSFKLNGYTIMIMKQAESVAKLETDFEIIENSFDIN